MKRFNIIGPPAILFFSKDGKEIKDRRLVGYNDPQSFLNHIKPLTLLK
jgi:thiol:disulfide interchange protein DsbD